MNADTRGGSRRLILDAIRRAGRIARIDLARATGISQATITTITADMLRQGLIEEVTAEGHSRRGRPRVDLALRGAAHVVVGVKVAHRSLSIALMDFAGILIGEHHAALPVPVMPACDLVQVLADAVDAAARSIGLTRADITAVGVALAGIVDASRGFVYWSPSLTDRNVPFSDLTGAALGLPVFVDNDANLVAMAEQLFGQGRDVSDFIVVTIENGVGMGIVLNGALYRGARGCGAEFGHTKVQLDGALCRCGQRGCLEAYVADYALLREASVQQTGSPITVGDVLDAARAGDATAQSIVNRAGRMFAMGLANIVNIFDPQLIILAGERMQSDHLYAQDVMADLERQIVQIDLPPPRVVIHRWGDLMWARGAAAYAIDHVADMSLRGGGRNAA